MTNVEYVKEMFALQQKLNDETNGIGWENGYTKNDRIINWRRCIYMESAELIDSFNWKHWKDINKATDWDNATIEVVDIWHFVMSLLLEDYKVNDRGDLDKLVDDVLDVQGFERFSKEAGSRDAAQSMELINDIESIMHMTTTSHIDLFDGLLKEYFSMSLKCGVDLKTLYKFYIAKNVLNQFRQDHGYKEGTYKKVWNGKEDNEVMLEILDNESLGSKELYAALEKVYKN
ncbi:dUTPase [Sulfurospirillum arcachonense]|uniref:dUTPase n=1 Tax=Sulfurospirillum arcachonense TaxID=57666 RepID=UPI0004B63264|nr:dUTP diphosphatase [Sulfurospirillum arcachonense]